MSNIPIQFMDGKIFVHLKLDKPHEIYENGECVDGSINLNLTDPESIEAIQIALRGLGWVSWKEFGEKCKQNGSGTITENIEFRSDEVYAQLQQELMGDGYLEAGEHTFPFSLQIPEVCPGSFEGSMGSIRYYLDVDLITKTGLRLNFKYDIIVDKQDDLNLCPEYKIPVQAEEIKEFCWITCADGRILFTLTTPFGAYAPMQKLHYILRVENQSMSDVKGYKISIAQNTTYTARTPHLKKRYESINVLKQEYESKCLKLTTRVFEDDIEVPTVPPSTDGDSIISIDYKLMVTAFISGCAMDSDISMPLHIGTIALEESLAAEIGADMVDISPTSPILSSTSSGGDRPPAYQSIKPPSFSEAIKYCDKPPSFDSAITASAPPYESIANERNRPFIGFRKPN